MTKRNLLAGIAFGFVVASQAQASQASLEDQLNLLNLPDNQAPASVAQEKLYAVQTRYAPLQFKSELTLGGAKNFTGSSFLSTQQVSAGYRFHFDDRWSFGVNGSLVSNSLTSSAMTLMNREGIVPDLGFAKYRADATVAFNVFYGKFRLTMDQVFYFDQFVTLGGGIVGQENEATPAVVGGLGFAFWMGRSGVLRVGMKDYYYTEKRRLSQESTHNLHGFFELGLMLGGGENS